MLTFATDELSIAKPNPANYCAGLLPPLIKTLLISSLPGKPGLDAHGASNPSMVVNRVECRHGNLLHRRLWAVHFPAPSVPTTRSFLKVTKRISLSLEEVVSTEAVVFNFVANNPISTDFTDLLPGFEKVDGPETVNVSLNPVEFKTYPDSETGPDKPHKRDLTTKQNEAASYQEFRKVVCKLWTQGEFNLIDLLDGGPGNHALFEDLVQFKKDSVLLPTNSMNYGDQMPTQYQKHYRIEVVSKLSGATLDWLIITIITKGTKESFDAWYKYESSTAQKAWFAECPPMPTRLELGQLIAPDRFYAPRIWNDPTTTDSKFHPNAYYELRAKKTQHGHGHQMCFSSNHDPILSGVSAGTADKRAAFYFPDNLEAFPHVHADVIPFLWALQLDGNPCDQSGTTLTQPLLYQSGSYIKKYMECRPIEPNANKFIPGTAP